jgi:predicted Zn-dependent peptidase
VGAWGVFMQLRKFKLWFLLLIPLFVISSISGGETVIPFQALKYLKGKTLLFSQNYQDDAISICIGFKQSGFIYDDPRKQGLTWVSAQVLKHNIQRDLEKAKLSQQVNIVVYYPVFEREYFTILLKASPDTVETAIKILIHHLAHPTISRQDFLKLLTAQKATVHKQLEMPEGFAHYTLLKTLFQKHPYGQTLLGLPSTLGNLNKKMVLSYFKQHFIQNNLVIAAAGNVSATYLTPVLEKYFGKLPLKASSPIKAIPPVTWPAGVTKQVAFRGISNCLICFGQPWVEQSATQNIQMRVLELQVSALLVSALQTQGATVQSDPQLGTYGILTAGFSVKKACATQAIDLIKTILKTVQTKGVESALKDLSTQLSLDNFKSLENSISLSNLKQALLTDLTILEKKIQSDSSTAAYYLWNKQTQALKGLAALSSARVTLQDLQQETINHLANTLLDSSKITVIVDLPQKANAGKEAAFIE